MRKKRDHMNEMEITENKINIISRRLIPLTKWPLYHTWPSIPALRNLVFNKDINGFKDVIYKCSGRILIDEEKFFRWVQERSEWK
jgi:hypothetical protein